MKAAFATKPKENKQAKPSPAQKANVQESERLADSEFGAREGMPLFLQGSFLPGGGTSKSLAVGSPDDPLEHEADRTAAQVMGAGSESCHCGGTCADCQENQGHSIQRKPEASSNSSPEAQSHRSPLDLGQGHHLSDQARAFYEPRMGHDFRDVRIHTGTQADESARELQARAFTVGRDVAFSSGWNPNSDTGQKLLAHELTHVVQQGYGDMVVRRDPDQNASFPEDGVCELPDSVPTDDTTNASSVDDETVNQSFEGPAEDTEAVATYPENAVCEVGPDAPSFYADSIDVEGMRNDQLNVESLQVDDWFGENSETSHPDKGEYVKLRGRLKNERTRRVAEGHLWLATALRQQPSELYMLMPGGERTEIISVFPEVALGVPEQSYPGPIMTVEQFRQHMADQGIPIMSEEEYYQRVNQENGGEGGGSPSATSFDPSMYGPGMGYGAPGFHGYVGGVSQFDIRASLIAEALPHRNANVRGGDLAEAFFQTSRSNLFGYAGQNYNSGRRVWSGDPLRPIRQTRGNDPLADYRAPVWSPYEDVSIKMNRPDTNAANSPSARTRYSTFLRGQREMLDASGSNFQAFQQQHGRGRTAAEISAGMRLAIPADEVQSYRALLADPLGYDLTNSGNQASKPNWEQGPLRAIYDRTPLPQPVMLSNGTQINNGLDVRNAHQAGQISDVDFENHMRSVGNAAASQVIEIPDFNANVARWYAGYENSIALSTSGDIRSAMSPEVASALEFERMRQQRINPTGTYTPTRGGYGSVRTGVRYGVRGSAAGAGLGLATDLIMNENADWSDPRYREYARNLALQQGAGAFISESAEAGIRAYGGQYLIREGIEATAARGLAVRLGSRAAPGLGDVALEGFDMLTNDREESGAEIAVRTTRAAVIGGGSAWAGAAVGTAIGGPVGFIVGFGVGAAVGWLGNKLLPGGREDWERQEEIRRRVEAIDQRVKELERRIEERIASLERLNTPLSSESASVAGVMGMPPGLTTNELFMSSSPESEQLTVGDLEYEYLNAILNQR